MKRIGIAVAAFAALLAIASCNRTVSSSGDSGSSTSGNESFEWAPSYEAALKSAEEKDTLVMLDFYTDW